LSYFKKFLYVFSSHRKQLFLLILVFFITSGLEAFGISLIGPFLSLAGNSGIIFENPILSFLYLRLGFTEPTSFIVFFGLFVVFVFVLKSLVYISGKTFTYKTLFEQRASVQMRLFKAYLLAPYEFHLSHNTASFINKISNESAQFTYLVSLPLIELLSHLIIVFVLIFLIAKTNLLLFLMAIGSLLPAVITFLFLSNKIKTWGMLASQSREQTLKVINHGLGGLKETRVIGCEAYFERELSHHVNQEARMETFFNSAQFIPRTLIEALLVVSVIAFVCLSQLFMGQDFQSSVATMGVFAVASLRLVPAASQLVECLGKIRNSSYILSSLDLDLRETEARTNKYFPTTVDRKHNLIEENGESLPFKEYIELSEVTYGYPQAESISLDRISLKIKKGDSIGLIGKSGAGKTTLVDVILGLLTPQDGDILVDGKSIYASLPEWKKLVGYIPQSIFLMDDTIEHNIAFGVPTGQIDRLKLQEAIKLAQLEDLIQNLPEGIHTSVGERGVRISGGQRQRIGIARALYHQQEILVLDEATSALDGETEQLVSNSIKALAGSKTLIIIAHRLSTVELCDCIYLMEKGEIVRSGSYKDVVINAS